MTAAIMTLKCHANCYANRYNFVESDADLDYSWALIGPNCSTIEMPKPNYFLNPASKTKYLHFK